MAFIPPSIAAVAAAAGSASSAIGIGASVLGAVGSVVTGVAGAKAAEYNKAVDLQQAKTSTEQAAYKAAAIEKQTRLRTQATQGAMLQNGLELSGSATDLVNAERDQGHLDALTAIYDGTVRANNATNAAKLESRKAANSYLSGFIGAGTKLMSGVADAYKGSGSAASPTSAQMDA